MLNSQQFQENYIATYTCILKYDLESLNRRQTPQKFKQNFNAISLCKILIDYIQKIKNKCFNNYHKRNVTKIKLDNVVLPDFQDKEPVKVNYDPVFGIYTITMTTTLC